MTDSPQAFEQIQPLSTLVRRVDFFMGQALQRKNRQDSDPTSQPNFAATESSELPPYDHPTVLSFQAAFGLSEFDLDLVAIALAPELDRRYGANFAYLQDDNLANRPTVDLALKLLCDGIAERVQRRNHISHHAPLVAGDILHLVPPANQVKAPLINYFLVLDDQITSLLLRQFGLDKRLSTYCQLLPPTAEFSEYVAPENLIESLREFIGIHHDQDYALKLYLQGSQPLSQRNTILAIAADLNIFILQVNVQQLLAAKVDFSAHIKLIFRQAWLNNALLYFEYIDELLKPEQELLYQQFCKYCNEHQGITILSGTEPWFSSHHNNLTVTTIAFSSLDLAQRKQCWQDYLALAQLELQPHELDQLADRFTLTAESIAKATAIAKKSLQWQSIQQKSADPFKELCAAARLQSGHALAALAQKIDPQYTWTDIVLPPEILSQLQAICKEAEYRHVVHQQWGFAEKLSLGKGLNVLFTGSPGTGKTMTAEAIANHLQLDLYKIDLSQIISKYIGDTEKNLSKIFAAASNSNAILLFDEADALFGKRSEVQDAHDRYANIEVGYLLQKMEEYAGITILTTNLRSNMDTAFERRLRFIVEFPRPSKGDRLKIWQQTFPESAPLTGEIDWDFLADKFDLTGANIKNVALTAAFHAADTTQKITMKEIIVALHREYQKMGQILRDKDLGDYVNR